MGFICHVNVWGFFFGKTTLVSTDSAKGATLQSLMMV